MQLTDYLTPFWANALIMLGVMAVAGGVFFACGYLGIKHGVKSALDDFSVKPKNKKSSL